MSTPDPFGDALTSQAQGGNSNSDPYQAALEAHAAGEDQPPPPDTSAFAKSPYLASLLAVGENALSIPGSMAGSLADAVTGANPGTHDWAYKPRSAEGQALAGVVGKAGKAVTDTASDAAAVTAGDLFGANVSAASQTLRERIPEAMNAVGAVSGLGGLARAASGAPAEAGAVATAISPEQAVANTAARQSGGAAGAAPSLENAPPELKAAISSAAQRTGGAVNPVALERHLDTAQLPLPDGMTPLQLRKGQALNDSQQISDEKNLRADPDTQGILSDSINDQDKKLVASMGEIRQRATPDIVQRNNQEHGQAIVDAIKNQDNQSVLDIRSKYKALADANGGDLPLDTGATLNDINARLKKASLRNTAKNNGVVSEVMDNLGSGEPMDFETFENARSRLAEVQRGGSSDGVAAGIVHDALNKMPLTPEASGLRDLANTARQAAANRFDTIRQNPAYDAAINDNVPKDNKSLHVIGAPSPLADKFIDQYALGNGGNASEAYVQRLKQAVPDPVISQSIEAATLNKLRDAAGIDSYGNGSFRNASYANALKSIEPKADTLLSPESVENTARLGRISDYVNNEGGKASSVNRSNTALTLQRFGAQYPSPPTVMGQLGDYGADVAASHLGPVGIVGKKIGQTVFKSSQDAKAVQALKDAKMKFALDATKPGAGLDELTQR